MEVLLHHVLERIEVACRRIPRLGSGDVETDHAGIAPAHGQLGDLPTARGGAHRRGDGVDREVGARRAAAEPVEDGLHHLIEGEAGLGAQLGRHAHLGIHHAVGGEVLGALACHSLDRVAMLHHADRVGERLQIQHEVVALGPTVEPRRQVADVVRRESLVPEFVGQLDHSGRAQAAVEMVVEERLGSPLDQLRRQLTHRRACSIWFRDSIGRQRRTSAVA